jgi:hypothetical protein
MTSEPAPLGLLVGGRLYTNSAAKFWPWLITDTHKRWPGATHVTLSTLTELALTPDLLDPQRSLQRLVDATLPGQDVGTVNETLSELELLGGPSPVTVTVENRQLETVMDQRALDALDAETFCCVSVWLLQWAAIANPRWREPALDGVVEGEAAPLKQPFRWTFNLITRPVSEGLLERTLTLALA